MNPRAERVKYVIQHKYGWFLTIRGELKTDFMDAYRWSRLDDIDVYMNGRKAPVNPEDYRIVPVKITYELEEANDVQQEREHRKSG